MIGPILRRAEAGRQPSYREVGLLLHAKGQDRQALLDTAGKIARQNKGDRLTLRGLLSLGPNATPESLAAAAGQAREFGCTTVVLRADGHPEAEWVTGVIRRVKSAVRIRVALDLGERSYDDYAQWRHAGADQYVLPHDTCNQHAYAELYPGRTPADRLTRYLWLRGLGYEVAGGLLSNGMSQSLLSVVDDMEILMNIGMEAAVIKPNGDQDDLFTLLAVTRLCLPHADIWADSDVPSVRSRALQYGANVITTVADEPSVALIG